MSFTANSTGGKYKQSLTVSDIPDHKHDQYQYYDGQTNTGQDYRCNQAVWAYAAKESYSTGGMLDKTSTTAHNNIQPYIVVYRWRRTI